jgi:hypothetical protein
MKKLSVVSFALLLFLVTAQIQAKVTDRASNKESKKELRSERKELRKLESPSVNIVSSNSFYENFGNVPDVKWKSSDYFDEATFSKDGHETTAYFDFDGKLVGTTQIKTLSDVPAKGLKDIKKRYKDFRIGPVIYFDDNQFNETDMMLYNLQFDDEDNYFVELTKGASRIIVRVDTTGGVYFFKQL